MLPSNFRNFLFDTFRSTVRKQLVGTEPVARYLSSPSVIYPSCVPDLILHAVLEKLGAARAIPRLAGSNDVEWSTGEVPIVFEGETLSVTARWISKSWQRPAEASRYSPLTTGEWVYIQVQGAPISSASCFLTWLAFATNGFLCKKDPFKSDGSDWQRPFFGRILDGVDDSKHKLMCQIGPEHSQAYEAILQDGRNIIAVHDIMLEEIGKTAYA